MKKADFCLIIIILLCCSSARSQEFFDPSHKYIVGAEYGGYFYSQDGMGSNSAKASGAMYGACFGYILSEKSMLNVGLQKVNFNYLGGEQFYKIPISYSYTIGKRGISRKCINPTSFSDIFFYFITLGFFPQTFELEGGLSLGFYDKSYTKMYREKDGVFVLLPEQSIDEVPEGDVYDITRRNKQVVPSIDLGFKWTFDFKHVHFTIHPKYSRLLVKDNIMERVNVETQERSKKYTRSAFGISGILSYSF